MTAPPDSTATLESLFETHYPSLVRFVFRRIGDRQLSEDLAAECYVRALGQAARTTITAGWLYGTARNLVGDTYRRRERERRLLLTLATTAATSADSEHSPLVGALAKLKAHDRELLVMLHVDNLSASEVAEALGISMVSVWKRGSRARDRLRAILVHGNHAPS